MKRKDFFRNLLMGGTGIFLINNSGKAKPASGTQKIWLSTLFITGFEYYDGPGTENLLMVGMPLQLNRQPHNRYDKNAIEVLSGEAKLGYIPRVDNKIIAYLMDEGIPVQAEIKELFPHSSFDKVKVEVWYERPVNSLT
jgi:hypothetical protein